MNHQSFFFFTDVSWAVSATFLHNSLISRVFPNIMGKKSCSAFFLIPDYLNAWTYIWMPYSAVHKRTLNNTNAVFLVPSHISTWMHCSFDTKGISWDCIFFFYYIEWLTKILIFLIQCLKTASQFLMNLNLQCTNVVRGGMMFVKKSNIFHI